MVSNVTGVESLQESEIFKGLTCAQVADVLEKAKSVILPAKSMLFTQGDPAERCFLVHSGRLKLTKFNEQGKEIILRYILAGELTAAMAVFKAGTYPVTAESIDEITASSWDKTTMLELMRQYPDIAINLLGVVTERIDEMQHRYLELCTEQVEQRIARSLLRLMRSFGLKTAEGIRLEISLSRQDIADYSGTTIYTVSRTLSVWEKKGWIQSRRERIVIVKPQALVQLAEIG
ncbi:Crp/Fnr family transcriptional regulator [Desulfopila sp. IMCC35006]|nr:Crp/Fnr family transcriptional regulator [Desulfopila sp. IMCC35006]